MVYDEEANTAEGIISIWTYDNRSYIRKQDTKQRKPFHLGCTNNTKMGGYIMKNNSIKGIHL